MLKSRSIMEISIGERAYAFSTIIDEFSRMLALDSFPTPESGLMFEESILNNVSELKLGALCARYWIVSKAIQQYGYTNTLRRMMVEIYTIMNVKARNMGLDGKEIMLILDSYEFEDQLMKALPEVCVLR